MASDTTRETTSAARGDADRTTKPTASPASGLFGRILVPYDFSAASGDALAAACDLAVATGGELIVLNALPPVTSLAGIRPPGGPVWLPPAEVVAHERERLVAAAEGALAGRRVGKLRCQVAVDEPLAAILAAARHADVVVMATTGRGALSHLLVGSVAEKVVRHAPIPVLTIGREAAKRLRRSTRSGPRAARPARRRA